MKIRNRLRKFVIEQSGSRFWINPKGDIISTNQLDHANYVRENPNEFGVNEPDPHDPNEVVQQALEQGSIRIVNPTGQNLVEMTEEVTRKAFKGLKRFISQGREDNSLTVDIREDSRSITGGHFKKFGSSQFIRKMDLERFIKAVKSDRKSNVQRFHQG